MTCLHSMYRLGGNVICLMCQKEERLVRIIQKCEQYWNEPNICDAEIHAILEYIHREAVDILKSPAP